MSGGLCSPCRPSHCLRQPHIKRHPRLPAQGGACLGDVGLDMALLARSSRGIDDRVVGPWATEGRQHVVGQLIYREAAPAAQVEYPSVGDRVSQGTHPCVHNIVDVHKVTRLLAITEDGEWLTAQQVAEEDAQDALIGIVQCLAWSVDVVHAEACYVEIEVEVDPLGRSLRIAFSGILRNAIIRDGLTRCLLWCWQH